MSDFVDGFWTQNVLLSFDPRISASKLFLNVDGHNMAQSTGKLGLEALEYSSVRISLICQSKNHVTAPDFDSVENGILVKTTLGTLIKILQIFFAITKSFQ